MFERLQKPFLTVETGEAYQPVRLTYDLLAKESLVEILNSLKSCEKTTNPATLSWNWFWRDECNDLHFESIDSFKKNSDFPVRLGTLSIRDGKLYLNLPSFKRACLAVPFFSRIFTDSVAHANKAEFINKVFGIDERLPHGFTELFKDEELDNIIVKRVEDYEKVQTEIEHANSADEAFTYLYEYKKSEAQKRLPYAERYQFQYEGITDPDIISLSFYIFLRSRELVAIRRWFGETGYNLADAAEETVEQVFGGMDIDIID